MPIRVKILLAVLLAAAFGAFALAFTVGGSGGECGTPDVIDELIPGCGDSVIQQQRVGVDMRAGYGAELTINGKVIPADEVQSIGIRTDTDRGVAQDTFVFVPGEGKTIEQLDAGQNCATVTYWALAEGRDATHTFSWCFQAT
jgi:hypothetical protein